MLILNFAHPLSDEQLAQITHLTGQTVDEVRDFSVRFDPDEPFAPQARRLMDQVGLAPDTWQREVILINLPSLSNLAAVLLAELHGRTGHFPAVLRLKPVQGALPGYEVAEIINLQAVRDQAREVR